LVARSISTVSGTLAEMASRLAFIADWLDPNSGEAEGIQGAPELLSGHARAAIASSLRHHACGRAGVLWRYQLFYYPDTGEVEMVRPSHAAVV
jgi:hypothetical protein